MELKTPETQPCKACTQCGDILVNDAHFCGKCGAPTIAPLKGESIEHRLSMPLWQYVAPAIVLWVCLLGVYAVFGVSARLFDLNSPVFDFVVNLLNAFIILVPFLRTRKTLFPLIMRLGCKSLMSFALYSAVFLFFWLFMWIYFKVITLIGVNEILYLEDYRRHGFAIWFALITICILPGIFEELAFRGFIMSCFEKTGSAMEAIIIQAAMFSILHLLPTIFISHFVLGAVLGFIRHKSKSLIPGIVIHVFWNAFVIINELYFSGALI